MIGLALVAVLAVGCSDGSADPSGAGLEPEDTLPGLLVSGATPDVHAAVRASLIAGAEELTFVSLPPGTLDIELWRDDTLVGDVFVIDAGQPWAVEFQHELDLNPGTTYELRVNGAQDLQGEFLAAPLTISFTTSGAALSVAGRIAFVSTRDGPPHIYVGDLDGSAPTRLALGTSPEWSPDGEQIAFTTWPRGVPDAGATEVWRMSADGTNGRRVAGRGAVYPSWSPDGVSTSGGMDPVPWITSALPDGRGVEIHAYGLGPDWSPDGRMLVYHRSPSQLQDLPTRIYVGDLTTGTYWLVPIIGPAVDPVDPDYADYDPVWSPARE